MPGRMFSSHHEPEGGEDYARPTTGLAGLEKGGKPGRNSQRPDSQPPGSPRYSGMMSSSTLFADAGLTPPRFVPTRIVSGGQAGADRGALDAAISLGIDHGGWCPAGRLAEDGPIPSQYQLAELKSRYYPDRTERNVLDSDATLILYRGRVTGGTKLTQRICRQVGKPSLSVSIGNSHRAAEKIADWLSEICPPVLNVAGPRESNAVGIHAETLALLKEVLSVD